MGGVGGRICEGVGRRFVRVFFLLWWGGGSLLFLQGVLRKSDGWMWFFDGEFVVDVVF
jgi:hypothetical protein